MGEADPQTARRQLDLEVFGHRLNVLSDAAPELVDEVVRFVNDRLETVKAGARRAPTEELALLCALNLAEELFLERRRTAELKDRVRTQSRQLLSALDSVSDALDLPVTIAPSAPSPEEAGS